MRLRLVATAQFKRDYKRIKKHGYDLALLEDVLDRLCAGTKLDARLGRSDRMETA